MGFSHTRPGIGGDTLSSMAAFYDTIISSSNAYIANKHSYAGGLITGGYSDLGICCRLIQSDLAGGRVT